MEPLLMTAHIDIAVSAVASIYILPPRFTHLSYSIDPLFMPGRVWHAEFSPLNHGMLFGIHESTHLAAYINELFTTFVQM